MSAKDRYRIPSTLDDPEKLAFWTIDEFIVLFGSFMVGIAFSRFVEGIVVGFAGVWILKRLKKGESLTRLRHLLFWIAPPGFWKLNSTLPSHKRRLAG